MSNLVEFAKRELALIGDQDDKMQQLINKYILDLVELFATQEHTGTSAPYALRTIQRLLNWKPIHPLTGENEEWGDVPVWDDGTNTQQNKRCSAVFRNHFDNSTARYVDGKVFSDNGGEIWYTNGGSSVPVVFPFAVPDEPEYIILEPDVAKSTECKEGQHE